MKRKIPPYNVLLWDFNSDSLKHYDVMPYLVSCWKEDKKRKVKLWTINKGIDKNRMPETFEEFKSFIESHARYQYWSRCEYEMIVTGWPVQRKDEKIDVYYQIECNIDVLTKHFMDYINS